MSGDELVLIDLKGDASRDIFVSFRDECRAKLARLKIQMTYHDIYGDVFPLAERSLDWFARTLNEDVNSTKKLES